MSAVCTGWKRTPTNPAYARRLTGRRVQEGDEIGLHGSGPIAPAQVLKVSAAVNHATHLPTCAFEAGSCRGAGGCGRALRGDHFQPGSFGPGGTRSSVSTTPRARDGGNMSTSPRSWTSRCIVTKVLSRGETAAYFGTREVMRAAIGRSVSVEAVNESMRDVAENSMKGIVAYSEDQLVSTDLSRVLGAGSERN